MNFMSTALVFLADGFEETEAIGTIDVLRRGGVKTTMVSISEDVSVCGAHGIPIVADVTISAVDLASCDALVLPGGMPGTQNLGQCSLLTDSLIEQYRKGKVVAAICAAPSVLGNLSIADGHKVTCYPGFEGYLQSADVTGQVAETDGNLITGRGPGAVFNFALKIVEKLEGPETAKSVAEGLVGPDNFGF